MFDSTKKLMLSFHFKTRRVGRIMEDVFTRRRLRLIWAQVESCLMCLCQNNIWTVNVQVCLKRRIYQQSHNHCIPHYTNVFNPFFQSNLTLQQLQEMAFRQQQQIDTQQQLLVAKEQRLKYLRQQDMSHHQLAAEYERLRRLREKVQIIHRSVFKV